MVRLSQIVQGVIGALGVQATPELISRIKAVARSLDLDAMRSRVEGRIQIVPWKPGDKAPTGILFEDAHPELKQGKKAYHVFIDGRRVYFQYTSIIDGNYIDDEEELAACMEQHKNQLVDELLLQEAVEEVIERL